MQLKICIYSNTHVDEIVLPKNQSSYWLYRSVNDGRQVFMEVTCCKNTWHLIENKGHHIKENIHRLYPGKLLTVYCENEWLYVYVLPYRPMRFSLFALDSEICIGRSTTCAISFRNAYISNVHAKIVSNQQDVILMDVDSKNGVYVNSKRITEHKLCMGDKIHMMGFVCIYTKQGLLVEQHQDIDCSLVRKQLAILQEAIPPQPKEYHVIRYIKEDTIVLPTYQIKPIQLPNKAEQYPLWYTLGPSITMGLATLTSSAINVYQVYQGTMLLQQAIPSLSMSLAMIAGTLIWPILNKKFEKKLYLNKKERDLLLYLAYIKDVFKNMLQDKEQIAQQYQHHIQKEMVMHNQWKNYIWCKPIEDARIWIGMYESKIPLDVQMEDPIQEIPSELVYYFDELKNQKQVYELPYTLSLSTCKNIGIYGKHSLLYAHQYILQLCYLHSYQDVKIFLVMEEFQARDSRLYWIPHVKGEGRCHLYANEKDMQRLFKDVMECSTCSILWIMHSQLEKQLKLHRFLQLDHVIVLHVAQQETKLSKYLHTKLYVDEHRICQLDQVLNNVTFYHLDSEQLKQLSMQLANIKTVDDDNSNIQSFHLFDLYRCAKKEQLNIKENWKRYHAYESLSVPIGIDEYGEIIAIDAHEKAHGPHGIIAGMTGSGKSEWLITYIISLAIRFSYEEVTFLFIDYKGEMMASALKTLPHTVGIMSNLHEGEMYRMTSALQKEIVYRQEVFMQTKEQLQESVMDIYVYQKLYVQKKVEKPLSHLFIIADEFAELKEQQPDFLIFLKQIARIGRSLGIHLLLATQKPTGVVDEQIWSNARFHVCLRVQDSHDSIEMLRREDAVFLKQAGEFYFQVGHDELFLKGRSAWAQAQYVAQDVYQKQQEKKLAFYTYDGSCIKKRSEKLTRHGNLTQLDAVIQQIQVEAMGKAKPLALGALPSPLYTSNTNYRVSNYQVCIGWVDDMLEQTQYPLYWQEEWKKIVVAGIHNQEKQNFLTTVLLELEAKQNMTHVIIFYQGEDAIKPYENFGIISTFINVHETEEMERVCHWLIQQTKYQILIVFYELEMHLQVPQHIQELYEQLLHHEYKKLQIVCFYRDVTHLSMRFLSSISCCFLFQLHDKSEYGMILGEQPKLFPLAQEGSALFSDYTQMKIIQCFQYENPTSSTVHKKRQIQEFMIPSTIRLPEFKKSYLYVGMSLIFIQDIWLLLEKTIVILYQRTLPKDFYRVIKKQLDQANWIQSKEDIQQLQENQIVVWEEEIFSNIDMMICQTIWERMQQTHIFLLPMHMFTQLQTIDAFLDLYEEGEVIWIGRGLQEASYSIKGLHGQVLQDINAKQGYLMTGKTHGVFQFVRE